MDVLRKQWRSGNSLVLLLSKHSEVFLRVSLKVPFFILSSGFLVLSTGGERWGVLSLFLFGRLKTVTMSSTSLD